MKTKKLTPRNVAPVQRENAATVSRENNTIAPESKHNRGYMEDVYVPFAGDDSE
jgi:prenylated cyclic peptide (anacyclamide/piricyclamide family)